MIAKIIKMIPFVGRLLIRYERALITIQDEFCDDRQTIIKRLDNDKHWQDRREFERNIPHCAKDWSEYPFA